ncbi:hypothetical protein MWU59_01905 [Flavobacteriaceae bacterium F08102]|nr:hypothetical protein [Flavobacteriaceae bacterium F08102]
MTQKSTKSQESSNAIERLYITMRHLFNRGFYKPMGVSGETLREALLLLRPEIYGFIADKKAELNGLSYVIDRLPEGIEECQFINLTADEGYKSSHFKPIIPLKRRRNCYRIDKDQMNIEITRGRSEIYDILTHLTFLFIESNKIKNRILLDDEGTTIREWNYLEDVVIHHRVLTNNQREVVITHLTNVLGRTFEEIKWAVGQFAQKENPNKFFHTIYWMGKLALDEDLLNQKRSITFSTTLQERIGRHIYGEIWANSIKQKLEELNFLDRPIHIISANMHSVMNSLYATNALKNIELDPFSLYIQLSKEEHVGLRQEVREYALQHGMVFQKDNSGTNIDVQIIDTAQIDFKGSSFVSKKIGTPKPVLVVMDYAFGEQAFETMDELLKPYICNNGQTYLLKVKSISIMGKAGILEGDKGDIMIPSAHIFEGTADNYPFKNELEKKDLEGFGVNVYEGTMVTVLGTSLQNTNLLSFFHDSTWNAIGLEMEGAHYQKAIQSASKIRGNISEDVKVRYAYYASDNPLKTGSTLASGGLGTSGVRPTYAITQKILEQIFSQHE